MIDLHSHILWGMDDGADTLEDSLQMCRIAYGDGIRTIVATPHTLNGLYQNDRPSILAKVKELNAVIRNQLSVNSSKRESPTKKPSGLTSNESLITNAQSSVLDPKSELTVLPGADVHLCEGTLPQLDQGKVTTLGDDGKCLLIEFPFNAIPYGAEEIVFHLILRRIIPLISHPERNFEIGQRPQRYSEMIRMGCLGQVTAMSLTGGFGPRVKSVAEHLLTGGLIHVIASDAHSIDGRPPVLSAAVRAAARIVGWEEAQKMVTEYPQAILEGQRPNVVTSYW